MVKRVRNITHLSRSGLSDWLIQRISAVIIAAYTLWLLGIFITQPDLQYADWRQLFTYTPMRFATLLCLLSLLAHAWVGVWTISTDYLKCAYARITFQIVVILALLTCFAWGIQILWGI